MGGEAITDRYLTLVGPCEGLFKAKGSKHFGYVYPIASESDVELHLAELRRVHHAARHHCYAWRLGPLGERHRSNDDGEPSNSAGMPIYGQIQSFEVTNILVVSVRYFGGVKLGVGGLVAAYKTSAQLSL